MTGLEELARLMGQYVQSQQTQGKLESKPAVQYNPHQDLTTLEAIAKHKKML
ncbi:MAG: hypothetical protein WBX01_01840 [Nitrososphaeraceae archaeon]|jgi:hypothetical protein